MIMFYHDFNVHEAGGRYRFWVLPIYFQGRDAARVPYLAVFPIGGTIRDFLFQDELWFALFPLTMYQRINDVETRNIIWPFISWTWGGRHERFRILPFYACTKLRDEYEKRAILWPIWTSARYGFKGGAGYAYIFWPLMGHADMEDQETWMLLPPFFRFSTRGKLREVYCPWPIVQYNAGTTDKFYFFPIAGRKKTEGYASSFILWPLYTTARHTSPAEEMRRTMLVPFVYSRVIEQKPAATPSGSGRELKRTFKIWPFFSWCRQPEGLEFRTFSLFPYWDFDAVERNYDPLWTVYSHRRRGAESTDEVLWGLFRYRRVADGPMRWSLFPLFSRARDPATGSSEWSVLKGLCGYEHAGGKGRFRILYFIRF